MFRQEFPERNGSIVSQQDRTFKILRVNLGDGLAAPPARCHQNPSVGYRHNGQHVPFSCPQHVGHGGHFGTETQSARQLDANARVNVALGCQNGRTHRTSRAMLPQLKAPHTAFAAAINVDLTSFMSLCHRTIGYEADVPSCVEMGPLFGPPHQRSTLHQQKALYRMRGEVRTSPDKVGFQTASKFCGSSSLLILH
jgi:hypothetical protein